jgi:hypothetical protein
MVHLVSFRETFIAGLYGLWPVVGHGVPPGCDVSVLGYGLSYLLALPGVRAGLTQRVIRHQQKNAGNS